MEGFYKVLQEFAPNSAFTLLLTWKTAGHKLLSSTIPYRTLKSKLGLRSPSVEFDNYKYTSRPVCSLFL